MRTAAPSAVALLVFLAACGGETPTNPIDLSLTPVPQFDHHAGAEYFLFGHQNSQHRIWRVATDGTATVTDIGATGYNTNASGMGTSRAPTLVAGGVTYPAGTHFGLLEIGGGPTNWVYVIDTNDGHAVPIVQTSRDIRGRGIDFGPDGKTLYVIEAGPGELSTVDLVTGQVTRVGSSVSSTALEWDPDGGRFIAMVGGDIYAVDHTSGASTKIGDLGNIGGVCTVTRSPQGEWYTFGGNTMYRFDPNTSAKTALGTRSGLSVLCGTAFAPERVINTPPTGDPGGPYVGVEGLPIPFEGTGEDAEGDVTFAWDFGDGATSDQAAALHAYGDDGPYTATFTVTDAEGISRSYEVPVEVLNVAPTVSAGDDAEVDLGDPFVLNGSFDDPGFLDTWAWTVDWGDGLSDAGSGALGAPIAPAHDYAAPGEYTVTLTVTDDDGGEGSDQVVVTVIGTIDVLIDIKPGSFPNSIGLNKKGVLPVAILTDGDFDAATVLVESVTLGNEDGSDTGVIVKNNGTFQAALEDVDGDGDVDMILHFEVPDLFANGDLTAQSTELILLGLTTDGRDIRGVDSVRMVGKEK